MEFGIGKDFEKNLGKGVSGLEKIEPADKPADNTPPADKPADNTPPADKPADNTPPADKPADKPDLGFVPADKPADKPADNTPPGDIDDAAILSFFNKRNNTEYKTLEEYQNSFSKEVEKEVIKEVSAYDDVLDEADKAYLNYKKETGRSRKDWDVLSQDISGKTAIEIARDRARSDSGLKLTNAEADLYLEDQLGIELSDDLEVVDNIKLNNYAKPHRDTLLEDQKKYREPLDEALRNKKPTDIPDNKVTLKTGEVITQEEYQKRLKSDRDGYISDMKKAVDSVTALDFDVTIDDDGEKRVMKINYELSKDDKHSMLSDALDIDGTIEKRFQTNDGFNHQELSKTLFRGEEKNFNAIVNAVAQRVRAATIQEIIAADNNENFSRRELEHQVKDDEGYGSLTSAPNQPSFGIQFAGFDKKRI